MAKYVTLTNYGSGQKGKRKKTVKNYLRTGPVSLAIITIVLTCLVALLFLTQVFDSSTKGFEITELRQRAEELKKENEKLEIEAAKLKSFENLESQAKKLNMTPIKNIVYVTRTSGVVASK